MDANSEYLAQLKQSIRDRYIRNTHGVQMYSTYGGQPIELFSREELVMIISDLNNELTALRREK